tara:strand:- start:24492 stop:25058 length:567 start_codon:yes stop_codon:yes gene_type:complete
MCGSCKDDLENEHNDIMDQRWSLNTAMVQLKSKLSPIKPIPDIIYGPQLQPIIEEKYLNDCAPSDIFFKIAEYIDDLDTLNALRLTCHAAKTGCDRLEALPGSEFISVAFWYDAYNWACIIKNKQPIIKPKQWDNTTAMGSRISLLETSKDGADMVICLCLRRHELVDDERLLYLGPRPVLSWREFFK